MSTIGIAVGMVFVLSGVVAVCAAGLRAHARSSRLAYVTDTDGRRAAEETDVTVPSLTERVLRPATRAVGARVRSLYPSKQLDRLHQQLLYAGLSNRVTAEEMATMQAVLVGAAVAGGLSLCVFAGGNLRAKVVLTIVLSISSILTPPAWLARKVRERTSSIDRDLPDVLDLLTIAVEAGLGLEQAMEAACADFDSPLAEELGRTLQEMSLGLSRQQALENLKDRSESKDLASFVVVLTQADALGMPIGRVLRSQADEMRNRRRARAREKAAKLPVKILFPLIFFILPALMIIVVGPAVASIARLLGI